MPRSYKTPVRPDQGPLSDGLVIQVGTPDISPRLAVQVAQRAVRESLRGQWEVQPLNLATRDFEVRPVGSRRLSVARTWELARELRQHRDVVSAEPALVQPGSAPEPSQLAAAGHLSCSGACEWALSFCFVQDAWAVPLPDHGAGKRFGEDIVIGHPDTGYTQHPEIWDTARLLADAGFDFEDSDSDPLDMLVGLNPGHGTSMASVIMSDRQTQTTAEFVTGVAPRSRLVPLRVSTSVIHLSFAKLTKAIIYAADQGHHVISMSLGGPFQSDFLLRAIRYAIGKGVILLGAAGNIWPWVVYPARYDEVIAVAACNCEQAIWAWSSKGPAVDVSAPGESVWGAGVNSDPQSFTVRQNSGTSYAVAITAGVCALWLAYHGRAQLIQRYGAENLASVFKEILITAGVDVPPNWNHGQHGAGILNARKVLEAPLPDIAHAGGVAALHASPVSRFINDLDRIREYFPTLDPAALGNAMATLLQTDRQTLDTVLADFGDELLFHIATNPEMRETIANEATGASPTALTTRVTLKGNQRFMSNASEALQQRIF